MASDRIGSAHPVSTTALAGPILRPPRANIVVRAGPWYPPDCDRRVLRFGPARASLGFGQVLWDFYCMSLSAALVAAGAIAIATAAGAAEQVSIPHGDTTLPGVLFRPEGPGPFLPLL